MSLWVQHLLVLALVAICLVVVGRQLLGTFRMRRGGKLGSCCAQGCSATHPVQPTERVVFLPSSSLGRKR